MERKGAGDDEDCDEVGVFDCEEVSGFTHDQPMSPIVEIVGSESVVMYATCVGADDWIGT